MFKTGIYQREQIKNPKDLKAILEKGKKISITLYNDFSGHVCENDICEKILLNFIDERGAFKRTYSDRFEEFDLHALKEIQNHFSPDNDLIIHDVAISDGRTACDFFEKVSSHFSKVKYYASDYDPYIFIVKQGRTKVVLNKANVLLEIVSPPFVFNRGVDGKRYPLNHMVRFILEKTVVKRLISKYKKGHLKAEKCVLFCPKAVALAHKDTRFHLIQHNLLKPSPLSQSVDVFRAMNILNPTYFTPNEFGIVVAHVFEALTEKGLFVMGSNQDSHTTVHGGIFQKTGDRFEKIGQSGNGSAVEDFILTFRRT